MSDPTPDALDAAIDRVASRLVRVADDPQAAQRIVAALPPRRESGWWPASSWWIHAAAVASVVIGVLYLRGTTVDHPGTEVGHDGPALAATTTPVEAAASDSLAAGSVAPAAERNRSGPRPVSVRRRAQSAAASDVAFGLPAIEVPPSLTVGASISPVPLETVAPASVAPISLNDLPLAGDAQTLFGKE